MGVVYTHFDAFRAGIQKIVFFLYWGPLGRFPPGDLAIIALRFSEVGRAKTAGSLISIMGENPHVEHLKISHGLKHGIVALLEVLMLDVSRG